MRLICEQVDIFVGWSKLQLLLNPKKINNRCHLLTTYFWIFKSRNIGNYFVLRYYDWQYSKTGVSL